MEYGGHDVKETRERWLNVPAAGLASPANDDEALRRRREEIRQRLLQGQEVRVSKEGGLQVPSAENQGVIQVPPGKLASFYWYESDPELYSAEVQAMRSFFPGFTLQKEADGRLAWLGTVAPGMLSSGKRAYLLHIVYEHSHPSNDSYGGSIKVYSIDPDLDDIAAGTAIPHTLRDSAGQIYLCTSRKSDFEAGTRVTSAASALAWAVKWIGIFELWIEGRISTHQFADERM